MMVATCRFCCLYNYCCATGKYLIFYFLRVMMRNCDKKVLFLQLRATDKHLKTSKSTVASDPI